MTRSNKMDETRKKRGNDNVNLDVFRRRLEEVTGYKEQHKVEEEADLPFNALSKIYSRKQALTVDHLLALSKTYGVSIDYLLGNDEYGSRADNLNVADVISMIRTLHDMGTIKMVQKYIWRTNVTCSEGDSHTVNVSSSALLVSNANFENLMQEYAKIRKAMKVFDDDDKFREETYNRWLNSKRQQNISIKGDDLPEQELIKEQCGYYD